MIMKLDIAATKLYENFKKSGKDSKIPIGDGKTVNVNTRELIFTHVESIDSDVESSIKVYEILFTAVLKEFYLNDAEIKIQDGEALRKPIVEHLTNWVRKQLTGKGKFGNYIADNDDSLPKNGLIPQNTLVFLTFYQFEDSEFRICERLMHKNPSTTEFEVLETNEICKFDFND